MTKEELTTQLQSKIQASANEGAFYQSILDLLNGVYTDKIVADLQSQIQALEAKISSISEAVAAPVVKNDVAADTTPGVMVK